MKLTVIIVIVYAFATVKVTSAKRYERVPTPPVFERLSGENNPVTKEIPAVKDAPFTEPPFALPTDKVDIPNHKLNVSSHPGRHHNKTHRPRRRPTPHAQDDVKERSAIIVPEDTKGKFCALTSEISTALKIKSPGIVQNFIMMQFDQEWWAPLISMIIEREIEGFYQIAKVYCGLPDAQLQRKLEEMRSKKPQVGKNSDKDLREFFCQLKTYIDDGHGKVQVRDFIESKLQEDYQVPLLARLNVEGSSEVMETSVSFCASNGPDIRKYMEVWKKSLGKKM